MLKAAYGENVYPEHKYSAGVLDLRKVGGTVKMDDEVAGLLLWEGQKWLIPLFDFDSLDVGKK